MKLLSFLHRWTGGLIGLLLAALGLSGTILVWEDSWISLPGASDPWHENVQIISQIAEREAAAGATRITFASEGLGLHQVAREGGAGAYLNQHGDTVATWSSQWQRPELWLFDLHHHLFAGHNGELVAGWAGVFGLLFVITGTLLWWRSRSKSAAEPVAEEVPARPGRQPPPRPRHPRRAVAAAFLPHRHRHGVQGGGGHGARARSASSKRAPSRPRSKPPRDRRRSRR